MKESKTYAYIYLAVMALLLLVIPLAFLKGIGTPSPLWRRSRRRSRRLYQVAASAEGGETPARDRRGSAKASRAARSRQPPAKSPARKRVTWSDVKQGRG